MKNKFKMIAQKKYREEKGKRDNTVSREMCSKFFSFSYTGPAMEDKRKINVEN